MRLKKEGGGRKKRKREKEREREKLAMFRQRPTDARQRDRETHSLVHVVFWIPWSLSLPLSLSFSFSLSLPPSLISPLYLLTLVQSSKRLRKVFFLSPFSISILASPPYIVSVVILDQTRGSILCYHSLLGPPTLPAVATSSLYHP